MNINIFFPKKNELAHDFGPQARYVSFLDLLVQRLLSGLRGLRRSAIEIFPLHILEIMGLKLA